MIGNWFIFAVVWAVVLLAGLGIARWYNRRNR
jgi:hypothetical protein